MQESFMGIVTVDPRIRTVADLKGKSLSIMPGPSAGSNGIYEQYLRLAGLWETMDIRRMGPGEFYDALANRQLDAAALLMTHFKDGWGPIFLLQELVSSKKEKVRALSLDRKTLEQAIAKTGLSHKVLAIPAGRLPGNEEPFVGWGILTTALVCQRSADKDLIYRITETLVEHLDEYRQAYPANANLTPEVMVELLPVESEKEVHPGALKYYQELGLWPRK
ncbi:MAG: TAXI family TRAP transporter solute-binding subunit [Deltaproteobacteria bacterium]|nr:TAXI family TRAP transporter solute-binding subunit [Deltaproteobacteria bacterium]